LLRSQPACHGVGGAVAAQDHADAWLPRHLAPGLRHHRGAALLAADHGLDAVGIVQAVEGGEEALTRHGERRRGALGLELIDQNLAAVAHALPPRAPATLWLARRR